jgi:hypothetical protein
MTAGPNYIRKDSCDNTIDDVLKCLKATYFFSFMESNKPENGILRDVVLSVYQGFLCLKISGISVLKNIRHTSLVDNTMSQTDVRMDLVYT